MTTKAFSATGPFQGAVKVPGDKSIAHRALILGAMADGSSEIRGGPDGADVQSTKRCLETLGFQIEGDEKILVVSSGWRPRTDGSLDAGNSGTTMRLLMGVLAGSEGQFQISGDASLSARPMGRVA